MNLNNFVCSAACKFPVLETARDKLFGYSVLLRISDSFYSRVQVWTSSFDRTLLLDRLIETLGGQVPLGDEEVMKSVQVEVLKSAYTSVGSTFVVRSLFDGMKGMVIMSAVSRLIELAFISLQQQVFKSQWRPSTNYCLSIFTGVAPYLVMQYLGYAALELMACKVFMVLLSWKLPYSVSNWAREMEFLSSDKVLHAEDFITRNALVCARNLFVDYVLFDFMFNYLIPGSSVEEELNDSFSRPDWAEIEACYSTRNMDMGMPLRSNASVRDLKYLTDEMGWMLGKIFIDLVVAKFSRASDLRDPMKFLFPKRMLKAMGSDRHEHAIKRMRDKIKAAIEESLSREIEINAPSRNKRKAVPVRGFYSYVEGSAPFSNKKVEAMQRHEGKGSKVKTRGVADERPEQQEVQSQQLIQSSFEHEIGADKFTFVRLTGGIYNGMNTWGVIMGNSVKQGHISNYMRSLFSGHIGRNAGIKSIGSKQFEIRPKGFDARLLGSLYRGDDANSYNPESAYNDDGLSPALQGYMPLEDAMEISDLLKEQAKEGEETVLIIFSREATKHNRIGRVKAKG